MSIPYTYWQEPSGFWLGYWNDYPDHMTQGHTLGELQNMLRDLREIILSGDLGDEVPRSTGVLEYA